MASKKEKPQSFVTYDLKVDLYNAASELFIEHSSITSIGNANLELDVDFLSHNSNNIPPEKLLFLAVVYQAVLDATRKPFPKESEESRQNREEALDWFFNPEYYSDLEYVCDVVGINSSNLSTTVRSIIEGRMPFDRRRINVLISNFDTVGSKDE